MLADREGKNEGAREELREKTKKEAEGEVKGEAREEAKEEAKEKARFQPISEFLRRRRESDDRQRCVLAWEKVRQAAVLLREKYQASQVVLFGSLARGDFDAYSDIDLLVAGLRESYWEAYGDMEEVLAPFQFHLLCSETAAPEVREKALREGVEL